jgi:hypothetical protein
VEGGSTVMVPSPPTTHPRHTLSDMLGLKWNLVTERRSSSRGHASVVVAALGVLVKEVLLFLPNRAAELQTPTRRAR